MVPNSPPGFALVVSLVVVLAGCSSPGNPGGGSGGATISSQVDFESDCPDTDCTVTATLASSDGTDRAVRLSVYDAANRTTLRTLHTFADPATRVGETVTVSVPTGTDIAVILERDDSTELTQRYVPS